MLKYNEAVQFIKEKYNQTPEIGLVLGSGLGSFTAEMEIELELDYSKIPHFPVSTVHGHRGSLLFGTVAGTKVLAMAGRFHYYEGYSTEEVIFPVRVMKMLGVKTLILTNAAGGVNPNFKVGDLMIIRDHISLFAPNPLIGKNNEFFGTRFPDMTEPYKLRLIDIAKDIAKKEKIDLKEGIYCCVTGPTFETHAEYKMINILGADVVGMSTVMESIVANHSGMDVFAMSVVTDMGLREDNNVITHEEVLEAAKNAEPLFTKVIKGLIAKI